MADPMLCSKILKAMEIESPFITPREAGSSELSDQQIESIDEGQVRWYRGPYALPHIFLKIDLISLHY